MKTETETNTNIPQLNDKDAAVVKAGVAIGELYSTAKVGAADSTVTLQALGELLDTEAGARWLSPLARKVFEAQREQTMAFRLLCVDIASAVEALGEAGLKQLGEKRAAYVETLRAGVAAGESMNDVVTRAYAEHVVEKPSSDEVAAVTEGE